MPELLTQKTHDESRQGEAYAPFSNDPVVYRKRFYIESYGCAMNFADSEVVASILNKEGFGATRDVEEHLVKYHERIPVEYIVQDLIELPVEVSVFYYRHPNQKKGTVSGFIDKELLHVKGDGVSTLKELTAQHPPCKIQDGGNATSAWSPF